VAVYFELVVGVVVLAAGAGEIEEVVLVGEGCVPGAKRVVVEYEALTVWFGCAFMDFGRACGCRKWEVEVFAGLEHGCVVVGG